MSSKYTSVASVTAQNQLVQWINEAGLLDGNRKADLLRKILEVLLHQVPQMIPVYMENILSYVNDKSTEVKKQVIAFIEEIRTGSLIIGYASMLWAAFSLSAVSFSLYKVVTFVNNNGSKPDDLHTPEETAQVALGLYISHAYSMLIFLYYFTISLLLVIGVHKNRAKYMRYYYYTGIFLLVLASVMVVLSTIFLHFLATVYLLKWCVILFYCLLVVHSTFLEIEEQNKPKVFEMQSLYNPQQAPIA